MCPFSKASKSAISPLPYMVQVSQPEYSWSEAGWITTSRVVLVAAPTTSSSLGASFTIACHGINENELNPVQDTQTLPNKCKFTFANCCPRNLVVTIF